MDRLAGRHRDCFFARSKVIRAGMRRVESSRERRAHNPTIAVLNPAPNARSDRVVLPDVTQRSQDRPVRKMTLGGARWLYFMVKLIVTFTITATGFLSFVPGLNCHCFRALTAS
jgi:hypothetical protein